MRIVSLLPSATEILFAVGAGEDLYRLDSGALAELDDVLASIIEIGRPTSRVEEATALAPRRRDLRPLRVRPRRAILHPA